MCKDVQYIVILDCFHINQVYVVNVKIGFRPSWSAWPGLTSSGLCGDACTNKPIHAWGLLRLRKNNVGIKNRFTN